MDEDKNFSQEGENSQDALESLNSSVSPAPQRNRKRTALIVTSFILIGLLSYCFGFSGGNTEGYNSGYDIGYSEGYDTGHTEGYASGRDDVNYDRGYSEGSAAGEKTGYASGYDVGKNVGYSSGYDAGKSDGYNSGYSDAKSKYSTTASSSTKTSSASVSSDNQSTTVYITKTGEKYHRSGCQYLRQSCIAISLKNAKSQGYTACSKCNPPN